MRNINLKIGRGEFVGLVGPNGAGKTTLLRGLLGLIPAQTGRLIYPLELKRRIGYVPQRDQLDPIYPLTAYDVIKMGIMGVKPWYSPPTKDIKSRAMQALEQVGMTEFARHQFATLSGGQRQRVLIARAIAISPALLILDEPTAGIDAAAESQILGLLDDFNKTHQMTILMVSHHLVCIQKHTGRVILVDDQSAVPLAPNVAGDWVGHTSHPGGES